MSIILASVGVMLFSCGGTQSSAPLWKDEPVQFRLSVEDNGFTVSDSSLDWKLENGKFSKSTDDNALLTAAMKGNSRASFLAEMTRESEGRTINWQVTEATSKDGRSTLQAEGNATCKTEKQVSAQ